MGEEGKKRDCVNVLECCRPEKSATMNPARISLGWCAVQLNAVKSFTFTLFLTILTNMLKPACASWRFMVNSPSLTNLVFETQLKDTKKVYRKVGSCDRDLHVWKCGPWASRNRWTVASSDKCLERILDAVQWSSSQNRSDKERRNDLRKFENYLQRM